MIQPHRSQPSPSPPHHGAIPLEAGDCLTRDEFERRYQAMPTLKKAELIEGTVHMPSPVRLRRHGRPHLHLAGWLATYEASTPGTIGADNATARLDLDNEPQPDLLLLIDPDFGGKALISADDYVERAPEFVAEVAASNASFDLHRKMDVYRRNSVQEYVVWRTLDAELDWFVLRSGQFHRLTTEEGILRSATFPGLWLDAEAMIRGDMARVLDVAREGCMSPEHDEFLKRLGAAG